MSYGSRRRLSPITSRLPFSTIMMSGSIHPMSLLLSALSTPLWVPFKPSQAPWLTLKSAQGAGAALISFLLGGTMNMLFDGASTLLYFASFAVYIRDIDPGLRSLNDATATETTHLVDLKTVASGHLSICVCLSKLTAPKEASSLLLTSSNP